jgi:hypothetical protein
MGSVFDNDKRRFRRFPTDVIIKFRRLDLSSSHKETSAMKSVTTKAQNISEVGVFIASDEIYPPDTLIEITFLFEKQNHSVKALARCAWCSDDPGHQGMGVEIFKIPEELYATIVLRAKRSNWVEAENEGQGGEVMESDFGEDDE